MNSIKITTTTEKFIFLDIRTIPPSLLINAEIMSYLSLAKSDDGLYNVFFVKESYPALKELINRLGYSIDELADGLTELFDFQKEDVRKYLEKKRLIDQSEPGTGKTAKALVAASKLKGMKIVIVPKSLVFNWAKEIFRFLPDYKPNWVTNENLKIYSNDNVINIMTYDFIRKKNFSKIDPSVVILDEAHLIKAVSNKGEPDSLQAIAAMSLAMKAEYAFLLTGTSIISRVKDIYNLLVLTRASDITFGYDFVKFGKRYCAGRLIETRTRSFYDFNGSSNLEELHQLLSPYIIRRRKDEVFSGIEKIRQAISIPTILKNAVDFSLSNYTDLFSSFMKQRVELSKAKIPISIELAESALESGRKVVIATEFKESAKTIANHFKEQAVLFTGETPAAKRQELIDSFTEDDSIRVFVMTTKAGGVGVNLQAASVMIMVDLGLTASEMLQCEDRIARIGQSEICNIYYIVGESTSAVPSIDAHIANILFRKFKTSNIAIDGGALEGDIFKELIEIHKRKDT